MKLLYRLIFLCLSVYSFAQVGIGTTQPTETLDVVGNARIRHIDQHPGNLNAAQDSIVVFDQDGVLHFVSSDMVVSTADPSLFPNNESFTSSSSDPSILGTEQTGDTYLNTTNNSWWYFDGNQWLKITSNKNLAEILSIGNDANMHNIENLADPINPQDAATKNYIDGQISNVQSAIDDHIANDLDTDATNEIQDLNLAGNTLTITNNAGATDIDLSPYLDNTDDQQITDFSLTGNTLSITLEDGGTQTVDLAAYVSTDNQNISGSAFDGTNSELTIGIEDGNSETLDLSSLEESADIAAVQADVDQNEADADAAIAANATDIATNATDIADHIANDLDTDATNELQAITSTDSSVLVTQNGNDYDLSITIPANNDNDATNELNTAVALNGTDLEVTDAGGTLTADLSSLDESADIAAVQADVDQNEADADAAIAANATDIATNATDIADHIANDLDTDATNEIQTITSPDNSVTVTAVGNNYEITLPSGTTPELTITKKEIGYVFASAYTLKNGTNAYNINCSVARLGLGRYRVTFATPHPNGANYDVVLSTDENGTNRDGNLPHVVEGTRTATSFDIYIGTGDNGTTADVLIDENWSFQVSDTMEVITDISGTNITIN